MTNDFTIRHSAALISAIELMIQTKTIKPGLGKTLQAIAAFWNPKGLIYPSQSTLAAMTGNHRRTIVTHIAKLTKLCIIQTETQPGRVINGEPVASTLLYRFNGTRLGQLFNAARSSLKKAAIKAAKAAELTEKDHSDTPENDHTNRAKAQVEKITVSAKLADWFKSLCKKAFQNETQHQQSMIRKQAYKAAVLRNMVKRGQAFSHAETKRRAAAAEKARPEREQASAAHNRIVELTQRLREARFIPGKFTPDMHTELMQLTENGLRLDPASRFALEKIAA